MSTYIPVYKTIDTFNNCVDLDKLIQTSKLTRKLLSKNLFYFSLSIYEFLSIPTTVNSKKVQSILSMYVPENDQIHAILVCVVVLL